MVIIKTQKTKSKKELEEEQKKQREEGQEFISRREKRAGQLMETGLSSKAAQEQSMRELSEEEEERFEKEERPKLIQEETEQILSKREEQLKPRIEKAKKETLSPTEEFKKEKGIAGIIGRGATVAINAISAVTSGVSPPFLKGDLSDRAQKQAKQISQVQGEIREGLRLDLQATRTGGDPVEILSDLDDFEISLNVNEIRIRQLQTLLKMETLGIADGDEILMDIQNRKRQLTMIRRIVIRNMVTQQQTGITPQTSPEELLLENA